MNLLRISSHALWLTLKCWESKGKLLFHSMSMQMFPILARSCVKTAFYHVMRQRALILSPRSMRRPTLLAILSSEAAKRQRGWKASRMFVSSRQPASLVRPWHYGTGRGKVAVSHQAAFFKSKQSTPPPAASTTPTTASPNQSGPAQESRDADRPGRWRGLLIPVSLPSSRFLFTPMFASAMISSHQWNYIDHYFQWEVFHLPMISSLSRNNIIMNDQIDFSRTNFNQNA